MNKINVLAASLALASSTCFAQTSQFLQSSYVGLSVGQSTTKIDGNFGPAGQYSDDKTDSAYKIYGGWRFNPMWALEGGYADFGKAHRTLTPPAPTTGTATGTVDNSAWFFAGKGTFALTPTVGIFGKAGITRNHTKASFVSTIPPANSGTGNKTKTGPMIGLGVEWAMNRNVALRFEFEDFGKFGDSGTLDSKVHLWSAGLTYAF
jgi:OOP family OmpA-OmpF porin